MERHGRRKPQARRCSSDEDDDSRRGTLPRRRGKDKPRRRNRSESDSDSDVSDYPSVRSSKSEPARRDTRSPKQILLLVCSVLSKARGFAATWTELARSVGTTESRLKDIVEAAVKQKQWLGFHGAFRQSKSKISLELKLRLCARHVQDRHGCAKGDQCRDLHLCPKLVTNGCDMDDECELGHYLMNPHNSLIIKSAGIDALPSKIIKRLLADTVMSKRQAWDVPPSICKDYNSEGGCDLGDIVCPALHMCWRSFPQFARDGETCVSDCGLNHSRLGTNVSTLCHLWGIDVDDFDWKNQAGWLLQRNGWDPREAEEGMHRVKLPVGKPVLSAAAAAVYVPSEKGDVQHAEICLEFLHGRCNRTFDCPKGFFHSQRPYQWQVKDNRSRNGCWLNFPLRQNDALEKAHVDVRNSHGDVSNMDLNELGTAFKNLVSLLSISSGNSSTRWTAEFDEMKLNDGSPAVPLKLRRLSTPSAARCNDQWATTWKWFFLDRHGVWTDYGTEAKDHGEVSYKSDSTSDDLEKAYENYLHNNGQPLFAFKTAAYSYEIIFKSRPFFQKNIDPRFLTERQVRRRPVAFTTLPVVEEAKGSADASRRSSAFPRRWTGVKKDSKTISLVPVSAGSSEWNELQTLVTKNFNWKQFTKAERIQNPSLYVDYVMSKEKLKVHYRSAQASQSVKLKEKRLFYPVHPTHVRDVLSRSIDWRTRTAVHHSTGQLGLGSYCYGSGAQLTSPSSGQTWVVVDAYIGTHVKGDPQLTCVNPHRATGKNFDCAVDDEQNPKIFVFFSFQNVYPHYVLTF